MHKHISSPANLGLSSHRAALYTLGCLDESSLVEVVVQSEFGPDFLLLVPGPAALPVPLSQALVCYEGADAGYYAGEEMGETPIQVANSVYHIFVSELDGGGTYLWIVGYLLGCLAVLAHQDRQLALVGMAHLCFLVSCVPDGCSPSVPHALGQADSWHRSVLQTYRAQVQVLKAQGFCIEEAWRAALSLPNG